LERKIAILRLLEDSGLILPPASIYVNIRYRGGTFSERTVHRLLAEMLGEGYVNQPLEREGYYQITESGKRYLRETLENELNG